MASTPTDALFIVEKHSGSAAPPGEHEVEIIKHELGLRYEELQGTFPFGRPPPRRRPRRPREGESTEAFVVGVYPSALHIGWRLPAWFHPPAAPLRRLVTALTVNVEPHPFWDGADHELLVSRWKAKVGGWRDRR